MQEKSIYLNIISILLLIVGHNLVLHREHVFDIANNNLVMVCSRLQMQCSLWGMI